MSSGLKLSHLGGEKEQKRNLGDMKKWGSLYHLSIYLSIIIFINLSERERARERESERERLLFMGKKQKFCFLTFGWAQDYLLQSVAALQLLPLLWYTALWSTLLSWLFHISELDELNILNTKLRNSYILTLNTHTKPIPTFVLPFS